MNYKDTQDKILFCDIESTGTNHMLHGIHQLAGIIEIDGKEVERFDLRMRPHPFDKIEESSLAISKVTYADIMRYPPADVAYRKFNDIMTKYVDPHNPQDRIFICGYNSQTMEKLFLQEWLRKLQKQMWKAIFHNITLDVSCYVVKDLLQKKKKIPVSLTIENIAAAYGISIDKDRLHDAVYDTEIARLIFKQTLSWQVD
jgi:DNA polymerase III alpha subunit (gram-positive type)